MASLIKGLHVAGQAPASIQVSNCRCRLNIGIRSKASPPHHKAGPSTPDAGGLNSRQSGDSRSASLAGETRATLHSVLWVSEPFWPSSSVLRDVSHSSKKRHLPIGEACCMPRTVGKAIPEALPPWQENEGTRDSAKAPMAAARLSRSAVADHQRARLLAFEQLLRHVLLRPPSGQTTPCGWPPLRHH